MYRTSAAHHMTIKRAESDLGLFLLPKFLSREHCRFIRENLPRPISYAEVHSRFINSDDVSGVRFPDFILDPDFPQSSSIGSKLVEMRPTFESFFGLRLGEIVKPYVTLYPKGRSAGKHRDNVGEDSEGMVVGDDKRRVTIVIFLNDERDDDIENSYSGGNLTFYELLNQGTFSDFGYPIRGESGSLIAFRSTELHEVTEVTRGTRIVVNTGFC